MQQRTEEQNVDVPVPLEEVTQLIPQAQMSDGIAEHIVNFPVPADPGTKRRSRERQHRARATTHRRTARCHASSTDSQGNWAGDPA